MTILAIFGILVIVFFVAIISPHAAGKIQHRSNEKTHRLKRLSNWLWDPLTWWSKTSLDFSRKAIVATTAFGKKVRRKLPF